MTSEQFSQYSHLLDRTARKVKQYAQRKFNEEKYDITVDQWLVIKNLDQHNDLNQSEMADLIGKDQPTLTRITDLLCKKGYVERRVHPTDRRSFILHLTGQGKEKVMEWSPKMAEIRMRAWENLTEDDYHHLKRILNTIYSNLDT
ncbi:MAG TPA: MarR family transcriptional regulator [Sphingobacteriaceae bacterium]